MNPRIFGWVQAGFCVWLFFIAIPLQAQIRSIERVSVDSSGQEGNGASDGATINSDGTAVAFRSDASNLDSRDLNSNRDVYFRNISNSSTAIASFRGVSGSANGDSGNGSSVSRHVWISADGRYITFASDASNLDDGDSNGVRDVYRYDRNTAQVQRVSLSGSGFETTLACEGGPVSDDGGFIAFITADTRFSTNDQNGANDVFLRNEVGLSANLQSFVSTSTPGNAASIDPTISGDATLVGFSSLATNLVTGDTNSSSDIFVFYESKNEMERLSVTSDETQGNAGSTQPFMSSDGRYVTFSSLASNLVSNDTNGVQDIFLRDRTTGLTERISVGRTGRPANGASSLPSVSSDGRYVAFLSDASNLVAGDTNGVTDAFVRDRQTSQTLRVNLTSSGKQGNAAVTDLQISADGKWVVFSTADSTLVTDANGVSDVFLVEFTPLVTPETTIDEAPEVVVDQSLRQVTIVMQKFVKPSLAHNTSSALSNLSVSAAKKKAKLSFTYRLNLIGSGGAAGDIRRRVIKRNEFTFKNLRPGTYSTNYRVIIRKGAKKAGQTNLSPTASFDVAE